MGDATQTHRLCGVGGAVHHRTCVNCVVNPSVLRVASGARSRKWCTRAATVSSGRSWRLVTIVLHIAHGALPLWAAIHGVMQSRQKVCPHGVRMGSLNNDMQTLHRNSLPRPCSAVANWRASSVISLPGRSAAAATGAAAASGASWPPCAASSPAPAAAALGRGDSNRTLRRVPAASIPAARANKRCVTRKVDFSCRPRDGEWWSFFARVAVGGVTQVASCPRRPPASPAPSRDPPARRPA